MSIEEAEQTNIQCPTCGNPFYRATFTGFGELMCKTCKYDITYHALLHGVKHNV